MQPSGGCTSATILERCAAGLKSKTATRTTASSICTPSPCNIEPEDLRENTTDLLASYLAAGLDPEVCTIFIQSQVPYHASARLAARVRRHLRELSRMVAFKEKSNARRVTA